MTFVQADGSGSTPVTDGITHKVVTCYGCNGTGNYCDKCPQAHIQLSQIDDGDEFTNTNQVDNEDDGATTSEIINNSSTFDQ